MAVMTVLGKTDKDRLGKVAPHEHLFNDITWAFRHPSDPIGEKIAYGPVTMESLGLLRRNISALRDNLLLDDYDTACHELKEFRYAGGGTLVDLTVNGLSRSPKLLRRAALDTGVTIVMGCGYYVADAHPADMDDKSVDEIAQELLGDLCNGVGDSGVRAGVIGEIGVSGDAIHPNEAKVLAASAIAQKATGVGVQVHTSDRPVGKNRFPFGLDILDIFEKHGADLSKISINHLGVKVGTDLDYCVEIMKRGAYVEFDTFGHEFYADPSMGGPLEFDVNRVAAVKALCDKGFEKQIMLSCDICHKSLLHTYGGWGYDHIITNIVPVMKDQGFDDATIDVLTVQNPAAFLDSGLE